MNTMKWLVKREFWEHKGGFFWAPAIVGGIATLFAVGGSVVGSLVIHRHRAEMNFHPDTVDNALQMGGVGDGMLMAGVGIAMCVLAFVLFFYLLGSLYDDRRDRSILFWKSLPISDAEMVLSKIAWAMVLAPLFSAAIGFSFGLVFWIIAGLSALVNQIPDAGAIFVQSHPFRVALDLLAAWPVQILWSLPTAGWLMMCSAWSRRVPFLWATALPVLACAMISFMDLFPGVNIRLGPVWWAIAYRGLLSIAPGSWIFLLKGRDVDMEGPKDLHHMLSVTDSWGVLGHTDTWIGAVLGVAMIMAAIRLRRWRDEG